MRKQIVAPLAAGVLLALAGAAQAATKTASFTVSATVATPPVSRATGTGLERSTSDPSPS